MNIKTKIHTYHFNLADAAQREPYIQLEIKLRNTPGRGHCLNVIPTTKHEVIEGDIELETEHLFGNQWNSNQGRVFDWYEEVNTNNRLIKAGHYLDITQEIIDIRRNTLKCRYTGEQFPLDHPYAKHGFNLNESAIGSVYLKESDLKLVRILPVCQELQGSESSHVWNVKDLTQEEKDFLLPLYFEAQLKRQAKDRVKQIEDINADYSKEECDARTKRDGLLWLLAHGINIENVIFYSHTGRFGFGWRNPVNKTVASKLREALKEFQFSYDIVEEK